MKREEKPKDRFQIELEDAVRVHDECLSGIASLIHDKTIMVEGRECRIVVTTSKGAILADVLSPSDNLPCLNFRTIYTGKRILGE